MKLLYVSYYDTDNVRQWSGIPYHMLRAARQVFDEVELIQSRAVPFRLLNRLIFRFCRDILKKGYIRETQRSFLKDYSRVVEKELLVKTGDLVLSDSFFPVALMDCDRPVAIWADATMKSLREHYYKNGNELFISRLISDHSQKLAIRHADLNIYASHWACRSALKDYGADPKKTMVIPFGANITAPPARELVEESIHSKKLEPCRLLLIGVEWERKGADLAVGVAKRLYEGGINVELTIMGCWPKNPAELPPYVQLKGFVNKRDPRENELFIRTLTDSAFLLFPSRAEAFGIVACEAAAYGIPTFSTDVGGIADSVREGKNGFNFPLKDYVEKAAEKIRWFLGNPREYTSLALKSRDEYEKELNWEAGFRKIRKHFESHPHE